MRKKKVLQKHTYNVSFEENFQFLAKTHDNKQSTLIVRQNNNRKKQKYKQLQELQ